MKVLIVLEPVIYRGDPGALSAHFPWVECVQQAVDFEGGQLALVANGETCRRWMGTREVKKETLTYQIDPFKVLKDFNFNKFDYARAAYGQGRTTCYLSRSLRRIAGLFCPDLVIMTSQNSIIKAAFRGRALLSIEQPPLPRSGYALRTGFDPCGHQTSAILQEKKSRILALELTPAQSCEAENLLSAVRRDLRYGDVRSREACAALELIAREGKVALLATQPTDSITFEGAYRPIEIQNLIFQWADSLPEGWLGVPTYHIGQRISRDMELSLTRSSKKIRVLPYHLSQGVSEALATSADGLVTVSSTSAATALLFGKKVAISGQSPLKSWACDHPSLLDRADTLDPSSALRLFVFLTHRFAHRHDMLIKDPGRLVEIFGQAIARTAEDWFLDVASWRADRAADMFSRAPSTRNLETKDNRLESDHWQLVPEETQLKVEGVSAGPSKTPFERVKNEQELSKVLVDRDRLRDELSQALSRSVVLKNEWALAVAQRDRLDGELSEALSRNLVLKGEWAAAVAQRDCLDGELSEVRSRSVVLENEWSVAVAQRDLLDGELSRTLSRSVVLKDEWAAAVAQRDRLNSELSEALSQIGVLERQWALAVAQRDRLLADRNHEIAFGDPGRE